MAVTAAFGLFVYGAFNLISVAFAVLFIGLGVDFGIQFCICYRAKRHLHDDLQLALRDAGAEVGVPLALAGASTAAGFYAFLPTDYRGVSELGLDRGDRHDRGVRDQHHAAARAARACCVPAASATPSAMRRLRPSIAFSRGAASACSSPPP